MSEHREIAIEALQGAGPDWRVVIDAISDPAVVLDPAGTVLHHSPATVDLFPRVRNGQPVTLLSRDPELLQGIERARRNQQRITVQLHDRVPVSRRLSAIITVLATGGAGPGDPAVLIILRDLTDQEQHAQLRADFIANASHELRTPLASMKVIVETLQGPARGDAAARERFLAMLAAQADRMTRLIDDLLSLNRVEMRAHLPPRGSVDIVEVVRQVKQALDPLAEANGIRIELIERLEANRTIRGEQDELTTVFQNLIQNAIKYGGEGKRIVIEIDEEPGAFRRGNSISVTVADFGQGIAPEHLPRLTERFYRVSAAASRERGGTGLGLAIVKYIISRHSGDLRIESELGKGSRFTVILPIGTPQGASGRLSGPPA